ncbi:hypothetical protein [Pseudazoarcus pumilus]|nr:hypothetical protein [Pseudazoarcus pumilus]
MVARISGWLVMALALVVLSGCASMQTQFAREAELVAARGEPHRIWDNPDGTRTYEYSTQPNGSSTWMYTIDANGSIVEQHDALSPRNRARVERGMSKDEVARLLGEHDSVQIYRRLNEEVWDWRIPTDHGFAGTYFNVHFIDDVVDRTSITQIHYGGDGGLSGWFGHPFGWGMGIGYHHHPRFYGGYGHPWGWSPWYGW